MKRLLFLCLLGFLHAPLHAQIGKIDAERLKTDSSYRKQIIKQLTNQLHGPQTIILAKPPSVDEAKKSETTSFATPGIHRLPIDGMPCIVPDTKDLAAINNVWSGNVEVPFVGKQPRIPNATPWQVFRSPVK